MKRPLCNLPKIVGPVVLGSGLTIVVILGSCTEDGVFLIPRLSDANASTLPDGGTESRDMSHVAFVFGNFPKGIVAVIATDLMDQGAPLEANMNSLEGELVVAVGLPYGNLSRIYFRFLNRFGETVAEYKAQVNVDRHLMTFLNQAMGQDDQFPYQELPPEGKLTVGEATEVQLMDGHRLWVGDRFLTMRGTAYLANSGAGASSVGIKPTSPSSASLWAPIDEEATQIPAGHPVVLESGSTLIIGVATETQGSTLNLKVSPL